MTDYFLFAIGLLPFILLFVFTARRQRRNPGTLGIDDSRHSSRHNPDAKGNG